jgi:hypothetical protein
VPGDKRIPAPPDEPPYQRAGYERPPVDADGRSWWPHDRAVSQLYGRLDTELAERLAARLRPEPQALFGAPYPPERPPEVPSAFLYAREDEQFDDEWSRWIARGLLGLEAIELTDPGGHAERSWSLLEAFVPGPPVWIDAPPVAVDAEWHRLPVCGSVTVSTPGASGSRPPGGAALLLRVLGYSAPTDPRCVPQRAEGASSSQRPIPGFSR